MDKQIVTPSAYATKLAAISKEQHEKYHLINEADPPLAKQIRKYWTDLGFEFPGLVAPWGAVFVSWCVREAGATSSEFKFSAIQSVFAHWAIQNALNDTGVFRGLDINSHPPKVGDIIQLNIAGNHYDYDFASSHTTYQSRAMIVIEIGQDSQGRYALTVAGNSSDTIRQVIVRLTPDGYIKQRESNPFICVIQNLK